MCGRWGVGGGGEVVEDEAGVVLENLLYLVTVIVHGGWGGGGGAKRVVGIGVRYCIQGEAGSGWGVGGGGGGEAVRRGAGQPTGSNTHEQARYLFYRLRRKCILADI